MDSSNICYAGVVRVNGRCVPLLVAGGLFVMTFSAGCAFYSAILRPADQPTPGRAYLYGRFRIDAPTPLLAMNAYQTMGLIMRCDDGSEYRIRFSRDKPVQVVAASPARCALAEVVFTDVNDIPKARRGVLGDPPGGFVLAGGTAYYLGDYFAESTRLTSWKFFYTEVHSTWQLTSTDDNYDVTTAEMKRTFANLAGLATENRMLVPRHRVPGDARKHAGRPPGGPDDIVSPERAGRLAGFTKRRYATPAECEAACPETGDCFPFRGDEGPAMTCVVHCKTDKDCPDGLACNCPDGDGSACRAIASTPEDRMAGICLSTEPAGERR